MQTKKVSTKYLFKVFFNYFKPYKKILFLDLFCASLTTVSALMLPLLVKTITNTATEDLSKLTLKLILTIGLIYIGLVLIETIAKFVMDSWGHIMGAFIETDMRQDLFKHIQSMSMQFFNNTKVGHLMSRITSDLSDISEFAHHGPEELVISFVTIVTTFIILSTMSLSLTLIIFIFLPFMIYFSSKLNVRMRASFKRQRQIVGSLNADVEDTFLGIQVVKSFANENIEVNKFAKSNEEFIKVKKDVYFTLAEFQSIVRIFDGLMYIVVVVVGALYVKNAHIGVGDYLAYLLYVTTLLTSLRRIVQFAEQFQRGMSGIERFVEIMDTPIDIKDKVDAIELHDVKGDIAFNNVDFAYEDGKMVLEDFDLHIKSGDSIALVGPSGGGKTTISSLIQRFYEISSGSITIDEHNIQDISLSSLRDNIGVVQQDVYLFSGTVFDNIVYGRPKAKISDVISAAKLAGADDFINELEYGYDTYVGERGVKLSGGQKQRISIARLFLKNPPILILDEATSALDNENERLIQQSLNDLSQNRTTITIAHRLTTIKDVDKIVVIDQRGIVEVGSHQTLMDKQGYYYDLYKLYESTNGE